MNIRRLGAIDVGSNSVRLLITDVLDYNGRAVFKKDSLVRIPLKLGEDTFSTGYISEIKKEKLAILMESFRGLIEVNDVEIYRACATSAIREALNAESVLEYVHLKSGIEIDVIDSKEEARFILTNNIDELLEENRAYVYTDVGGGNTELIIYHQNKEVASEAFKLGTIRSLSADQEKAEWNRMKEWLGEHSKNFSKVSLIGSGGNINKLDSLLRRCGRIRREELVSFAAKFRKMSYEERLVNLKINLNRSEVLLPAIEIYLRVMKLARALVIETPIIGVADGIIKDLYMTHFYQESAPVLSVEK